MNKEYYTISNNNVYLGNVLIGSIVTKSSKKIKVLLKGTKNEYRYIKL